MKCKGGGQIIDFPLNAESRAGLFSEQFTRAVQLRLTGISVESSQGHRER